MITPIRVLVIEDNKSFSTMIKMGFEGKFLPSSIKLAPPIMTASLREAFKKLDESPDEFDIIILDLILPDSSNAEETFSRLYAKRPDIPIMILSGMHDIKLSLRLVERGAESYVVKERIGPSAIIEQMLLMYVRFLRWKKGKS